MNLFSLEAKTLRGLSDDTVRTVFLEASATQGCMLSAVASCVCRLNDVFFAVHASLAGAAMLGQIATYDKGSQTLSTTCKRVMAALAVGLAAAMAVSLWPAVPWEPLDFFYLLGYIKARRASTRAEPKPACATRRSIRELLLKAVLASQVVVTVIKYMPQVCELVMMPISETRLHLHAKRDVVCVRIEGAPQCKAQVN